MDRYQFTGNIGNDAESKQAANGKTMITFSVAIDKSYKDASGQKVAKTKWISCTRFIDQGRTWGVLPFLKKGTKVLVEGEPEARAWMNQQSGEPNSALNVLVRELELIGGAAQAGTTQAAPQPQAKNPHLTTYPAPAAEPHPYDNNQPTDDLPF